MIIFFEIFKKFRTRFFEKSRVFFHFLSNALGAWNKAVTESKKKKVISLSIAQKLHRDSWSNNFTNWKKFDHTTFQSYPMRK
jgi:hypothetical protein